MDNWLIPANESKYDFAGAFKKWGYIDWNQRVKYEVGDVGYLYSAGNSHRIKYKVKVVKKDIPLSQRTEDELFWRDISCRYTSSRYVRLKLISVIDKDTLSLKNLRVNGLETNIRSIEHLNGSLLAYIEGEFLKYENCIVGEKETYDRDEIIKNELQKIDVDADKHQLVGVDRIAFVKTRINQSFFRDGLINRYGRCCICGMTNSELLVASHIKPWSVSSPIERTDICNGLLLCPNHDKLFDRGLISFEDNGNILISNKLTDVDRILMNVHSETRIKLENGNLKYVKYHRENIYISD